MEPAMSQPILETPAAAGPVAEPAVPAPRVDLYAFIHKALRRLLAEALCRVGATDPADAEAVAATLRHTRAMLELCDSHWQHENAHLHPALERAAAGSAARIAGEHVHHAEAIADLRDLVGFVDDTAGDARRAALTRLYHALALFVADNLQHMHVEETAHNAVLWAHYDDAALLALHAELLASIPPAELMQTMPWFLRGLNAAERVLMVGGMPPPVQDAVLGLAADVLPAPAHAGLARALGRPVRSGLVA
jgi:hypothetical protein